MEENKSIGRTRDFLKKIEDCKGTFDTKMRTIKDRNNMGPTDTEDIKKRWKNTQKNYRKSF